MGEEYVPFLALAGGEPLVTRDLWKVLERCTQRDLHVTLATDGAMLTPQMCERLSAAHVNYVEVSLDSLDPQEHDEFRGMKGAWTRTVPGIRNPVAAGIRTGMACCYTRFTADALHNPVKFAIDLVLPHFLALQFHSGGTRPGNHSLGLDAGATGTVA
jgi:MoaA/NifB/PqqE/SkfB family radical SAM enzyme